MKACKLIIVFLMFSIFAISCMKEEMETEPCSCTTSIWNGDGLFVSSINTAEMAPITGDCSDLDFFEVDTETGEVTTKICG